MGASAAIEIELPEQGRLRFQDKTFLNMGQLAAALGANIKTVARHMDAGDLPYHEIGVGKVRPRRVCTLTDVAAFFRGQQRCKKPSENLMPRIRPASIAQRVRRSGISASATKAGSVR